MINIHRITISGCHIHVDNRELLEAFREALKKNMKASSVLFNLNECVEDFNSSPDEQKGDNHD